MLESPLGIAGLELLTPRISKSAFGTIVSEVRWESDAMVEGYERTVVGGAGFLMEPHFLLLPAKLSDLLSATLAHNRPGRVLRCTTGEIYLVVVDMRPSSPTFGRTKAIYMAADDLRVVRMPASVACGYLITSQTATIEERLEHAPNGAWQWLDWRDSELQFQWPTKPLEIYHHEVPCTRFRPNSQRPNSQRPNTQRLGNKNKERRSRGPVVISASLVPKPRKQPESASVEQGLPGCSLANASGYQGKRHERILVLGSQGQLGRDLCEQLSVFGKVIGTVRRSGEARNGTAITLDMARPASLRQSIRDIQPTLIVNACAMTGVAACERHSREAQMINATAPMIVAEEAAKLKAPVIHYCTSLVYGGGGSTPWRECDTVSPVGLYARTKSLGSQAILASPVAHLVLRSNWLYSAHSSNYVRAIIERAVFGDMLTENSEQYGTPTPTSWLAKMTVQLLLQAPGSFAEWLDVNGGLFHAAPLGYASRSEVVENILSKCRSLGVPVKTRLVRDAAKERMLNHRNPVNCRLDCSRLSAQLGECLPTWQSQIEEYVGQILLPSLEANSIVAA